MRLGSVVDYEEYYDANSGDARIVKAAICAGFYPQILRVENPPPKFTKLAGAELFVLCSRPVGLLLCLHLLVCT